jgi:hypothetical protein
MAEAVLNLYAELDEHPNEPEHPKVRGAVRRTESSQEPLGASENVADEPEMQHNPFQYRRLSGGYGPTLVEEMVRSVVPWGDRCFLSRRVHPTSPMRTARRSTLGG